MQLISSTVIMSYYYRFHTHTYIYTYKIVTYFREITRILHHSPTDVT